MGPEWYLDSGATHHMTNDLNNLTSYFPYKGFNSLHIGDGHGMRICHIGSCTLPYSHFTFLLRNILHVPTFTNNLLSLSKLLSDNSILIEFFSSYCVIKDRETLKELLQVKLISGLYALPPLIKWPP